MKLASDPLITMRGKTSRTCIQSFGVSKGRSTPMFILEFVGTTEAKSSISRRWLLSMKKRPNAKGRAEEVLS